MRRFVVFLALVALAFVATACGDDGQPSESTVPATPSATQNDGAAQSTIEVEITADGFNPPSAKVTPRPEINFNNNDSKPHTIVVPAGHEQVVKAGETFTYKEEGCCAATFTDKETGAEFEITVPREATGLYD
jgi:plastocyanin